MPSDEPLKVSYACIIGETPICGISRTNFGSSLALEGDVAVIGSPYAGEVHIYRKTELLWSHEAVLSGPETFGATIDMSGKFIAIGVPAEQQVKIYKNGQDGWTHSQSIMTDAPGCFARTVKLEGPLLVVSNHCASIIHTYDLNDMDLWSSSTQIGIEGTVHLGSSIDLADGLLIALSRGGGTYAFEKTDDGWTSSLVTNTASGQIATNGLDVAVQAGSTIHVHSKNADSWRRVAELESADASPFDWSNEDFGKSIAFVGRTLVVGAPEDDPTPGAVHLPGLVPGHCAHEVAVCVPPRPGSAYVFEKQEAHWSLTAKLIGEFYGSQRFGEVVTISKDDETTLAVGAPFKLVSAFATQVDLNPEESVHFFAREDI